MCETWSMNAKGDLATTEMGGGATHVRIQLENLRRKQLVCLDRSSPFLEPCVEPISNSLLG